MNDLFGNITKTVNETTKKAIKASNNFIDLTKASINIKMEENKKESFFREIGQIMFGKFKTDSESVPAEILDFCKCIDEIDININNLKGLTAKIKKLKYCISCGVKLDTKVVYCYSCGVKQPEIEPEPEDDDCNDGDDCCCCGDDGCNFTPPEQNQEECGCCESDGNDSDCCDGDCCCEG